jgi:nitroreductase/NAD-dependent dihydropyrimidine dehydrogenase PreA subunit
MGFFTIDQEKCLRDGHCVAECPLGLIEFLADNAYPTPVAGAEALCINCGHCVSVCPQEALRLRTMRAEECPPVQKELRLSPEQTEQLFRSRRSIRTYLERPVEREKLLKLIDLARYAPSGHNVQPVHWLVIQQAEEVRRLAEMVVAWMRIAIDAQPEMAARMHLDRVIAAWEAGQDRVMRSAPHLIVAHAVQGLPVAQTACIIALTYLELAATQLGLGACWAGYFTAATLNHQPLMQTLALPEGHQCYGAMMVGYQKYQYHRMPTRNEPRIAWR